VDKVQVFEKKFNPETGEYVEGSIGNTYTIERYMPVPYDLTVQVDIWTSNTDQKFQLMEQLLVLFNPSINLKTNDNPFDWTNLTYTELVNVVWSVRQIPSGTDDIIDVTALNFTIPIFLNPPAKVKRQTLIHTILTEIKRLKDDDIMEWDESNPIPNKQWVIVTFENLKLQVRIEGNKAYLLNQSGGQTDADGNLLSWRSVLENFGETRMGISHLRLRRGDDPDNNYRDIIAVINDFDPVDTNVAEVDVDENSLPATSLPAITAIINPQRVAPGKGLPNAALGQRYLVLEAVPQSTYWGALNANANDIIEYNGSNWIVSFDSSAISDATVLNSSTGLIYEWRYTQWISAYEGTYRNGWWRIYL
jgi:hypothetical protein